MAGWRVDDPLSCAQYVAYDSDGAEGARHAATPQKPNLFTLYKGEDECTHADSIGETEAWHTLSHAHHAGSICLSSLPPAVILVLHE